MEVAGSTPVLGALSVSLSFLLTSSIMWVSTNWHAGRLSMLTVCRVVGPRSSKEEHPPVERKVGVSESLVVAKSFGESLTSLANNVK